MIDVNALKSYQLPEVSQTYTGKDCILYALGVGLGGDPMDPRQLQFLLEDRLQVLPTFATVMGYPGFWQRDPGVGLDWRKAVHGGIDVRLHAHLPASGTVVGKSAITRVVDKGRNKGALLFTERTITNVASGALLATVESTTFCRGDGGFDGGDEDVPVAPFTGEGPAHFSYDFRTSVRAALIYRLSGDMNPLHADPAAANAAGFERPILHGLCSFGVAGLAVLASCTDWDARRLERLAVRFSAPAYPGETIRTEIWRSGPTIAFRSIAVERGVEVLSNGRAEISSDGT